MARVYRRLLLSLALVGAVTLLFYRRSHSPSSSGSLFSSSSSSSSHPSSFSRSSPQPILPTTLLVSTAGFNQFANLYLKQGTIYLLSPPGAPAYDPKKGGGGGFRDVDGIELLPIEQITSTGLGGNQPYEMRQATEKEISECEIVAAELEQLAVLPWEDRAILELDERRPLRITGTTLWFNESGLLFLAHYYHLWVEMILGSWRSLVRASDGTEDHQGNTRISDPSRIMMPHADEGQWRDRAGLNGYLFKTLLPSTAHEYRTDWEERIRTGKTYVFDRVVITDRTAGSRGTKASGPEPDGRKFWKFCGNAFDAPVGRHWWQPIRNRLLDTLPPADVPTAPTITYISRQGYGRSLRPADHDALVEALEKLVERKGWILETPQMEKLSYDEQLALAARTDVLLGVHGNGLSHQMWMDPTPYSTVIEMFDQDGFCYDYALPAQALGHAHYIAWASGTIDTHAKIQKVLFTEAFQGRDIRATGSVIVDLIEKRLEGWKPSV